MPYATNEGIRIHCQVDGDGSPLVPRHGLFRRLAGWSPYGDAGALKPNYRLFPIDGQGPGASDKPHDGDAQPYVRIIPPVERPEATDPKALP